MAQSHKQEVTEVGIQIHVHLTSNLCRCQLLYIYYDRNKMILSSFLFIANLGHHSLIEYLWSAYYAETRELIQSQRLGVEGQRLSRR